MAVLKEKVEYGYFNRYFSFSFYYGMEQMLGVVIHRMIELEEALRITYSNPLQCQNLN